MVVTGAGAGRKSAGNDMSAVVDDVSHAMLFPVRARCYRGNRATASIIPPTRLYCQELTRHRSGRPSCARAELDRAQIASPIAFQITLTVVNVTGSQENASGTYRPRT